MGEWAESSKSYKRRQRAKHRHTIRWVRQVESLPKPIVKRRPLPQMEKREPLSRSASLKTEYGIKQYIKKHFKTIFPHFKLVGFEKAIYGTITGDYLGLVDMIMKCGRKFLVVEIKNDFRIGVSNVWSALKVAGYAEAFRIEQNVQVVPMILVEKQFLYTDLLPVLYKLKIGYITFERNDKLGHTFEYFIP